jgi:serine/threonine protein kinase/formylglycine-generating enzyme required for sulfatase activity
MPSEWVGGVLGGYLIIEQISTGSMAEVYKALQTSMNRMVAVKIMSPSLTDDPEFVARFRQEARTVASLEHPHILPVIDFGEQHGTLYLVMRYVNGGTLANLIEKGPLPPPQALRYLTEIGEALDYAHSLGIVHRDIKPKNVLLDAQGNPFITDFGLAKLLTGGGITGSGLGIIGTPHYMSPEQGRGQAVDSRSDIYSLGVVLYQMITGRVPFDADSTVGIIMRHIADPVPDVTQINPDLPPAFNAVFERALHKEPGARYQTAHALAQAVAHAMGTSVLTGPVLSRAPSQEPPTKLRPAPEPASRAENGLSNPPSESPAARPAEPPQIVTPIPAPSSSLQNAPNLVTPIPSRPSAPPARTTHPSLHAYAPDWKSLWPQIRHLLKATLRPLTRQALAIIGGAVLVALIGFSLYSAFARPASPMTPSAATPTGVATPPGVTSAPSPKPTIPPAVASATRPGPTATEPAQNRVEAKKDGMILIYIPAGNFLLGSADADPNAKEDEKPQERIYLDAYWMDQTEVTVDRFAQFVIETHYQTDAERGCCDGNNAKPGGLVYAPGPGGTWTSTFVERAYWKLPDGPGVGEASPRRPVVQVTWNDAQAYCAWAGRRLPTEAEWDKAARGTDGLIYPWGNDFDGTKVNFCDKSCAANWRNATVGDGWPRTSNVGVFPAGASPFGLLDMSGNVWELVNDLYDFRGYFRFPTANPPGVETGTTRVVRGGSWLDTFDRVRPSARSERLPDSRDDITGFRCAADASAFP